MLGDNNLNEGQGLRYTTTIDENILGVGCDVDVVVDLISGEASAVVSMRRVLSPNPAFQITRDTLAALAAGVKMAKDRSDLFAKTVHGAKDHQLNFSYGGATLVIVRPEGKATRFALHIGLFHREGVLDDLSSKELDDAVQKLDALVARVLAKIKQ